MLKAVIDRFEGNYAIVLVGDKEIKLDVLRELLPDGAKEGTWLKISFEINSEGEIEQREKISNLLEKIKNKKLM